MTETTALLRAIHYDIVGVIGFLMALLDAEVTPHAERRD